jgi:hypothetical protein
MFNWINIDIFITCIIFSIIYFWTLMIYLELQLINVNCPIMFYENHYKNDEI